MKEEDNVALCLIFKQTCDILFGASIPDVFEIPAGRPAADLDHVVGGEAVEAVAGGQRRHVDQAEGKLHKHLVLGLVLKQDG